MTTMPTLTPEGARRLAEILGDTCALRVRIEPGGCLGLRYAVTVEELASAADPDVVTDPSGVRLLIDPASAPLLQGAVIGLDESGFSVRNPNSRGSCACGATFAGPLRT